ncbi:MAG TPA: hypothetical protein VMZ05_03155 [Spirochaetota bacterium]|nr:hypothetical protein [Spirochaetota bacterium]
MKKKDPFDILILLGRPASGKSEIIHYLKNTALQGRIRRFHIAEFEEIDDFSMLWAWLEEDRILEEMGNPRLHTTADGYFKYKYLWDLLVRRIVIEYKKRLDKNPAYHENRTAILEFSRGSEHGGYNSAFHQLTPEILEAAAVMYIDVSYDESLRKNRKRYNPKDPGSILQHSLPDEKMERLYRETDWEAFTARDPEYIELKGIMVPYIVFENEDDVTTGQAEELGKRLEDRLSLLWRLYHGKKPA